MTIKSVAFTEEETVYRINYWEIPSRIRNAEYTFRYSLGSTAAIYMFDGNSRNINSYQKAIFLKCLKMDSDQLKGKLPPQTTCR